MNIVLQAGVVAFAASLLAHALCVLVLMPLVRAQAVRRVAAERKRFAAVDAQTWRPVKPALLGVESGSLAHIAGVVQAEAPVGLTYQFRARDTHELNMGIVRVSLEVGKRLPRQ